MDLLLSVASRQFKQYSNGDHFSEMQDNIVMNERAVRRPLARPRAFATMRIPHYDGLYRFQATEFVLVNH